MKSRFLSLNAQDLIKGVIMTVIGTAIPTLITILSEGHMPTLAELKSALIIGLAAGLSYLVKNFFTNSTDVPFTNEGK